jgi:uncharacterized protein YhbP (UPF0306 family)
MEEDQLWEFLSGSCVLCLATGDPDGPYCTPLYYLSSADRSDLLFLSDPASKHCRDIVRRPQVAAAVYAAPASVAEIRGAQLRGWVRTVPQAEALTVLERYRSRFPDAGPVLERAAHRLYGFYWTFAKWTDNRRGFGWKREYSRPLPKGYDLRT